MKLLIMEPVQYSAWWWVAVAALVALFMVWLALVPFLTRRKAVRAGTDLTAVKTVTVQEKYRRAIESLNASLLAGEISERELHLGLSATVREFVSVRTGITAQTMTYSDLLADKSTADIAEVIAQCYHPAFSSAGSLEGWDRERGVQPITVHNALMVVDTL